KREISFGEPGSASAHSVFEAGFDASWEIDLFGGVRRDEEAALAQVQAAEERREDVLVTLVADVARNYLELRGAERQIEILDQTGESQKVSLALARVTSRRPDLRRSERELAAATARIGVATADLFPRFNLLGRFGRRSDDLGDFDASSQFWSAGFGFRWPILAGGRIRANIRVQE